MQGTPELPDRKVHQDPEAGRPEQRAEQAPGLRDLSAIQAGEEAAGHGAEQESGRKERGRGKALGCSSSCQGSSGGGGREPG